MTRQKIHIVYEYGSDLRPHSSSYIRLLRPLIHPGIADQFEISFGPRMLDRNFDAVIVDRLWRPDISMALAKELVADIHHSGALFIYAIDDNLLDLPLEREDWPQEHHLQIFRYFLEEADCVWVSTQALKDRLTDYNPCIFVFSNNLDERLLIAGSRPLEISPFGQRPIAIGYMGTTTHIKDFEMIIPALQQVWQKYPKAFEIQIVGVAEETDLFRLLEDLPVRIMNPDSKEQEYPLFHLWFAGHLSWDIAISPLRDTPYTYCKSDIKFLDYSAIGAAGIYSRVNAYQSTVQHGETGWLTENTIEAWKEAMDVLLTDAELRNRIAKNSAHYLYSDRILAKNVPSLLETIQLSLA